MITNSHRLMFYLNWKKIGALQILTVLVLTIIIMNKLMIRISSRYLLLFRLIVTKIIEGLLTLEMITLQIQKYPIFLKEL